MLVLCEEWGFYQHRRDEVNTLEYLKVDFHVVWQLSSLLFVLRLRSLILQSAEALCKEFLVSHVLVNLNKDLVGLEDVTKSECCHASLR